MGLLTGSPTANGFPARKAFIGDLNLIQPLGENFNLVLPAIASRTPLI
jgi:hypothetical protein